MAYTDSFWILNVCIAVSLLILRKPLAGAAAGPPTPTDRC